MNKTDIKGVYIRFLASSSAKVGTFSLSSLEQKDSNLICSVSQLRYNVNKTGIKDVYIRFLASSLAKVGTFSLSPLEQQDSDLICSVSQLRYNVNKTDIKGVYIRFLASSYAKVSTYSCSLPESTYHMSFIMLKWSLMKETEILVNFNDKKYDHLSHNMSFSKMWYVQPA